MISLEIFNYKCYNTIYACVAQPVVQLIRNEQVAGSSPVTSSISMLQYRSQAKNSRFFGSFCVSKRKNFLCVTVDPKP